MCWLVVLGVGGGGGGADNRKPLVIGKDRVGGGHRRGFWMGARLGRETQRLD